MVPFVICITINCPRAVWQYGNRLLLQKFIKPHHIFKYCENTLQIGASIKTFMLIKY